MTCNVVRVPQMPWHGDSRLHLEFPDSWDVVIHNMEGHDRQPLSEDEIKMAFAQPIGVNRIKDLARGKRG